MPSMTSLVSSAPADVLWSVVTDVARHGRYVPLTSVTTAPGEPYPGWRFTAYTGVRPVAMPDHMAVTLWQPPRRVRIVKLGPVLLGWADIEVEPLGDGRSRVTWTEEITVAGLGALTRRLGDVGGKAMVGRALAGLVADAEALAGHAGAASDTTS